MSGLLGMAYPDDLAGQRAVFQPLLEPLVKQILGEGKEFEIHPRRGSLRNGTLPPCEVNLDSFYYLVLIVWS